MASRSVQIAILLMLAASSCRHSSRAVTTRAQPVTRSGPGCDSLARRLAVGDMSIKVHLPVATAFVAPPQNPPTDLRGNTVFVWFTIDASGRGRVDSLTGSRISSYQYQQDFISGLERMRFAPAVAEGCAVPSLYPLRVTF
jgi:hypothetical protein